MLLLLLGLIVLKHGFCQRPCVFAMSSQFQGWWRCSTYFIIPRLPQALYRCYNVRQLACDKSIVYWEVKIQYVEVVNSFPKKLTAESFARKRNAELPHLLLPPFNVRLSR